MKSIAILAVLALAGCERNLLAGVHDAEVAGSGCPTPAQPLAAGNHQLYLNTEGVVLHKGASDSRTNTTDLIVTDPAMVPAFLPGAGDRDSFIQQIVTIAQGALAPYSLDITTTRPLSGDYSMLVLGGDATITNCPECYSAFDDGCGPVGADTLGLAFDFGEDAPNHTPTFYANSVLHGVGIIEGLTSTVQPGDCQCTYGLACVGVREGPLCTYGSDVQVDQSAQNNNTCGRTTQDEPALLAAALGCR